MIVASTQRRHRLLEPVHRRPRQLPEGLDPQRRPRPRRLAGKRSEQDELRRRREEGLEGHLGLRPGHRRGQGRSLPARELVARLAREYEAGACEAAPSSAPDPSRHDEPSASATVRRDLSVLPVRCRRRAGGSLVREPAKPERGRFSNPLQRRKPARKVSEMMQENRANSYLFGGNAPYVEELYEAYLDNPGSVPDNWRAYFDALQNVPAADGTNARDVAHAPVVESFAQRAKANAFGNRASSEDLAIARKQVHVQSLIAAYRIARLALGRPRSAEAPASARRSPSSSRRSTTSPKPTWTWCSARRNTYFTTAEQMTLREIVQALRETYCGTIGAEYMHITEPAEKRWWQQRLEIDPLASRASRADEKMPHPRAADRGRRPRALPAHQVRRPEALLARRRRELHRLDGRADPARRRQGRAGDRDRHGAPRPPQRAGQHARQDAEGPVRRVRPHGARRPARRATSSTTRASRATSRRRAARCT